MMNNIFNQFDPSFSNMNPYLILILMLMLNLSQANKMNILKSSKSILLTNFKKENQSNMLSNNNKMNNLLLTNILMSISIINLMALPMYAWSATSQLSININLILMLWMPILIMILMNKKKHFLIHLIPPSTPNILIPFMFLIETISFFIRPLTLTMRLTANMIAGHIMISLNSNLIINSSIMNIFPSISFFLLNIMESIVAILQAYIIMTLISSFISEI